MRGEPISATFNKLRISTPRSPNHCWCDGFEERYASFLSALADNAVTSINNLCALTVGEDKALLLGRVFQILLLTHLAEVVDAAAPDEPTPPEEAP